MVLDLAQCEIRTPSGPETADLYRILGEMFVPDQPLFERLLETGRPMYTWTPYTLYHDQEIVGNVSLMPLRIWLDGNPAEVVGVASVATVPQYRRQGVARHLLQHCLEVVDQKRLPAVLFTSQPEVYAGAGFVSIPQKYSEWRLPDWQCCARNLQSTWLANLAPDDWVAMARLYDNGCSKHDGTLARDQDYWEFYQTLFELNPRWHIIACRDADGVWLGYARCEEEPGRLLVSELCSAPDREDVADSLVDSVVNRARQLECPVLSLAFAPSRSLERLLRSRGVKLAAEGPSAGREVFMVRPVVGQTLGPLAQLQWSLADKF